MSRRSDTGNFVMLILAAGFAGAYFGNWAFQVVLWVGAGVMVLGALAYILEAWGVGNSPAQRRAVSPGPSLRRVPEGPDPVLKLLEAVRSRASQDVERLVLKENISPFQNAWWKGRNVSALRLAEEEGFDAAARFFQEWSRIGPSARFSA